MNIYSAISANIWKTRLIIVLFIVFITTLVYVYTKASGYDPSIVVVVLILASITSVGSYFYSDKIVLATSGAKPISKTDNPHLYNTVENLTIGSGLPLPKIYIIHDPSPNAFATGRDPKHAVVVVTTGLMEKLNNAELEGVIAHELSHIQNYDIRLMAIVAVLVGFVAILADIFMRSMWYGGSRRKGGGVFILIGIVFALLTPIIATLIQLAVSRKREFLADASGVLITRYPEGLANALEKIASDPKPVRDASNATAHLYIENPFKNKTKGAWFASLFNTHPPVEERIKILRSM
ncbi:MAG: M48 family metallopeptidase [Candidatus Levybacteria bacterium]|nr:M48 family metallopeptidase [Candidatus Levybacteria bacterium]